MRGPKAWRCFRAFITGYFWLPCPNCGQMFAGFEKGGGTLWHDIGSGQICCPRCPTDALPRRGILHPPYHIEILPDGSMKYVYD